MKTRTRILRHYRMLGLAILATMLAGACPAAPSKQQPGPMPDQYESDGDNTELSSGCQDTFYKVAIPKSTALPHKYVLLLVFDNVTDADAAGHVLFQADPSVESTGGKGTKTVGCMTDPEPTTVGSKPVSNWGLKIKGSCPSDCTSKTFTNLSADGKRLVPDPVDDPLSYSDEDMHWGIFFADLYGNHASEVRVWQIRVKGGHHAQEIIDQLNAKGLYDLKGYEGHLLLGYRPCLAEKQCPPPCQKGKACPNPQS